MRLQACICPARVLRFLTTEHTAPDCEYVLTAFEWLWKRRFAMRLAISRPERGPGQFAQCRLFCSRRTRAPDREPRENLDGPTSWATHRRRRSRSVYSLQRHAGCGKTAKRPSRCRRPPWTRCAHAFARDGASFTVQPPAAFFDLSIEDFSAASESAKPPLQDLLAADARNARLIW